MKALHAAQSFGVVCPKKAFVFGHMVILKFSIIFYNIQNSSYAKTLGKILPLAPSLTIFVVNFVQILVKGLACQTLAHALGSGWQSRAFTLSHITPLINNAWIGLDNIVICIGEILKNVNFGFKNFEIFEKNLDR